MAPTSNIAADDASKNPGNNSRRSLQKTEMKVKIRASVSVPKNKSVMISKSRKSRTGDDDDLADNQKRLARMTSRAIHRFDKRGTSKFANLATGVASSVLAAYLGFRDPRKRRREYLIPKDKAAWLEWLVYVAKKRVNVEYLTDKELRKVIIRARPNLSPHKKAQELLEDPDLPPCIEWTEKQVGDWISSIGYPELRETFVKNFITGRRLVLVDCSTLNKMGMSDLTSMREVAGKIRELLGTPPPNALRPIMRVAPFERFLRRKVYNGRTYDEISFEKFCDMEGFNYDVISSNKNAQIPCTCEVLITTPEQMEDQDSEGEEEDEDHSLKNAPTVEYLVRNAIIRNKTVDQIMNDILENVFLPPRERKYGKEVWGTLKRGIGEGYDDLHLYYPKDKLEFASGVAHHLIDELYKTVAILNDISQLEKHVQENITQEDMAIFQEASMILMEEAAPIASLLALGELDLESIFRKEPTFEKYVDEVVHEAERRTNELVPDAREFVDDVIAEAWRKIPDLDLKELDPQLRRSILKMANAILHGITEDTDDIVESVMKGETGKKGGVTLIPASPKGKDKGKEYKKQQDFKQEQQKRKQSQLQTAPRTSTKPTVTINPSQVETQELMTSEETSAEKTAAAGDQAPPGQSEADVNHQTIESRKTLVGDRKSTNVGDNKDAGGGEAPKKGKGKKGHHVDKEKGDKDKDKLKKESQEQEAAPGGGEGEGVASMVASETLAQEQSVTVQTLTFGEERKHTAGAVPPSPIPQRLLTGERRDSPLLRSPMTVTTADRVGTGDTNRASFASSSEPNLPRTPQTPQPPTQMIVTKQQVASQQQVRPSTQQTPQKPTTPITAPKKKILRMSKDQDKELFNLLDPNAGQPKKPSIEVKGHDKIGFRQGKSLVPPPQQIYNHQEELARQEQQRAEAAKQQGQKIQPTAYHQRRGVVAKGEKDTTRKFNSIFDPEEGPHEKMAGAGASAKPDEKKHFVLIPKAVKQPNQQSTDKLQQPTRKPTEKIAPPPPKPQITPKAATTQLDKSLYDLERKAQQKPGSAAAKNQQRSQSTISDSAQVIWEQMKEQYEIRKSAAPPPRKPQEKKPRQSKDISAEEKIKMKAAMGDNVFDELKSKESKLRHRTLMSAPAEVIVDMMHVKEMKEHRDEAVEDWAKKHSLSDPDDSNKEERARLVRMTADKVVTEICTMALTHMLLEAEAGKNTEKIMDTLRRLQIDNPSAGEEKPSTHRDIKLWKPNVEQPKRQSHRTSVPPPGLNLMSTKADGTQQQGRLSNQTDKSGGRARSSHGTSAAPEQYQQKQDTEADKQPLRSILHTTSGADKLKAQAKSVVMNAVKGALDESGKTKSAAPPTKSFAKKDTYVTRL